MTSTNRRYGTLTAQRRYSARALQLDINLLTATFPIAPMPSTAPSLTPHKSSPYPAQTVHDFRPSWVVEQVISPKPNLPRLTSFSTAGTSPATFSRFTIWLLYVTCGSEDSAIMSGKTLYGATFKDVNFVPLQSATFCVQCELISNNSKPYCLACGSHALLGLSRMLGGSMRNEQTAHLITDIELNNLVRDLLRTVPDPDVLAMADHTRMPSLTMRSQLRLANAAHPASGFRAVTLGDDAEIHPAELDLEPAISAITERAQHLTGATGAAIALRAGDEIVCRARAGRTAPDLGVRLQTDAGISAEAVRSGEIMLCHDAERNPRVDLASCRRLGVRSILVSPLRHYRRTLGVFEVLSSSPGAFDDSDVATMQLLSGMMVAAISRISTLHQAQILPRVG
jgi:putative methionine-R-sulfoxide reductase with GAF domain